jgi:hypothetical protein
MVFLDKGHRTSHRLIEQALVKCFEKLTPVIGKNHGFEDYNVFNFTSGRQHQRAISHSRIGRRNVAYYSSLER